MGISGLYESQQVEVEEFRRMLLSCAGMGRRKEEAEFGDQHDGLSGDKLVCVTSGVSFLGLAIVNRLLIRGYSVRLIVTNEGDCCSVWFQRKAVGKDQKIWDLTSFEDCEDKEKLREMELSGEMMGRSNNISAVMANFTDVQNLSEAFDGCRGVFHTAAIVDPAGLSGYSKSMADIEVKATENVMEACSRTSSVRSCVLTSSLLACIWRDNSGSDLSSLVNQDSWSDQSVCIEKKLWYALGKLRAEKAAWRMAEEKGFKLVTICPGLITGPEYYHRNPTATVAYLKGVQEMYADGLLATVDVNSLAEAHVSLFEAMNKIAFGRYVCFDGVIRREAEAEKLAGETGTQTNMITGNEAGNFSSRFELSNMKLSRLMMSRTRRCCNEC